MPTTEPLEMPAGYGATTRTRPWSEVTARLAAAEQYWVASNRPGGSPHDVPVDGLWLAELANAKYPEYGIAFDAESYRDPFVLRPRRAFAWSSFPADATRYRFGTNERSVG